MLHFFRTYQRYFFILITIFVVISFSFFGTYNTIETTQTQDRVAFVAIDGSKIYASEVEAMVELLSMSTKTRGRSLLQTDAVLQDFLASGLAAQIAASYADQLAVDLEPKLQREKRFKPYTHPSAKFISSETVWGHFAPTLQKSYRELRESRSAVSRESFEARVELFLSQQQFPAPMLAQVLRYQEQQYPWISSDPNLSQLDLSLFGYRTLEDWFGPKFIRLACQFIINSAAIAEQKGYQVTLQQALSDLLSQAQAASKGTASSARQLINSQLRLTGLDEYSAAKIWRQVLLFQRLFNGVDSAVLVDPLLFEQYAAYALESVEGDSFSIAENLRIADFHTLQKFETYLNAIAPQRQLGEIPSSFFTPLEVQKQHPELVQKRYLLDVAEVSKRSLQTRVGVKEMWSWETEEENWSRLLQEFPELASSRTQNRFEALELLAAPLRRKVDEYARESIVEMHPEWIEEALKSAKPNLITLSVRLEGGDLPIKGVQNREEFLHLLDAAPLDSQLSEELKLFTADGQNYYRIAVVDRDKEWTILPFAEVVKEESLERKVLEELEPYYAKLRVADSARYLKSDQSWKPLEEVQDLVAAEYYRDLLKAIEEKYQQVFGSASALSSDAISNYRLLGHLLEQRERISRDPLNANLWNEPKQEGTKRDRLADLTPLSSQFKPQKTPFAIRRSDEAYQPDLFLHKPGSWSPVVVKANGELWFFVLSTKETAKDEATVAQQIGLAREKLGAEAQKILMKDLLVMIENKRAMSLAYLEQEENLRPEQNDSLTQEDSGEEKGL